MSKPTKDIPFYPSCKVVSYPDSFEKLEEDERLLSETTESKTKKKTKNKIQ